VIRQVFLDLDGTLTDSGLGIARCIIHGPGELIAALEDLAQ